MGLRCSLGLLFALLTTFPRAATAAEPTVPPLDGAPSTEAHPPDATASPATDDATETTQPSSPEAPVHEPGGQPPTDTPAATAPAPDPSKPPPVSEPESALPEADVTASTELDGYEDELAPLPRSGPPEARRPWELLLGLGIGNAFCEHEQADSECPAAGASALFVGGGYRFHPHFSFGLEAATWSYAVQEGWRGQLDEAATDAKLSSSYLALYGRWYWFDRGQVDPYLHAGIGLGAMSAKGSAAFDEYEVVSSGWVIPVGIGVDFQIGRVFRLGPQALVYWHHATKICETSNDTERCHDPGTNRDGRREGDALPWRIAITGTFTLGTR